MKPLPIRRRFFAAALVLLAALPVVCGAAGDAPVAEVQVKAAFLYKFIAFVEWPGQVFERPDSPLVIGVMGADALADELANVVSSRNANGRAIVTRKLRPNEPVAGLHMLFIGGADTARMAAVVASTKGRPMLTVTESDDVFALGSAINFVVVDNKVRFDVALRPAEQVNLKISSRLLAVARRVVS